jgi:hypothetical protein
LTTHRSKEYKKRDGRRESDADYGVKEYSGVDEHGKLWNKTKTWFGFKLHLIVDCHYELPIAYEVTKASTAETPKAREMVDLLAITQPEILKDSEYFLSDKGNDDTKLIKKVWDEHKIKWKCQY